MAGSTSTFLLSILLKLKDEASKGVDSFAQKLASLDKQSTKTLQNIKKITDALKGLQLNNLKGDVKVSGLDNVLNQIRSLKQEATSANRELRSTLQMGGQSGRGQRTPRIGQDAVPQPNTVRPESRRRAGYQFGDWMKDSDKPYDWHRDIKQDEAARKAQVTSKPEERRGFFDRVESLHEGLETGGQVVEAWRRRTESLEKYTDAYLELSQARQKFLALNLSPEENTRAFDAVSRTVKELRGLSLAETTETITDLHTALGDLGHAIEALPIAAKYRFGVSTLLGDRFSSQEIEQQIQSGFRFLEMINAVGSQEKMSAYFNRVQQMTAATGGRVTPNELLQMAQTGGTAVQGLTLEGLTSLTLPMIEMGGSRTGTSLQSLFQQVIAGRIQQKGLEEWHRLGLLDESKIEYDKGGKVKSAQAGAVTIGDLLQKNPLAFTDALRDAMKAHGIKTEDPDAVIKELAALKMPRTPMELTSLLINQRTRVEKDMGIVKHAKEIDPLYGQALDADMGKLKEFEAQWTNFKAEMGKPMLEIATGLTQSLLPLGRFFADHPTVAEYGAKLFIVSKGLGAILETGSLLNQSGIAGWFSRAQESARAASAGMEGVEGKLSKLQKLSSSPLMMTLKFAAVGIALDTLIDMWQQSKEHKEWQESKGREADAAYQNVMFGPGRQSPADERHQLLADKALEELKLGKHLEHMLEPDRRDFWEGFFSSNKIYGARWYNPLGSSGAEFFDPETAAGVIQHSRSSVALDNPYVMKDIITEIRAGGGEMHLSQAGEDKLLKAFELAKPEIYKQAELLIGAEQKQTETYLKIDQTLPGIAQSFSEMSSPAERLPALFGQVGSAAEGLAGRLNNTKITPTIDWLNPPTSGDNKGPIIRQPEFHFNSPNRFLFNSPNKRALGGPVKRGSIYQIGEAGPEWFTPERDGFITPNHVIRQFKDDSGPHTLRHRELSSYLPDTPSRSSAENVVVNVTVHVGGDARRADAKHIGSKVGDEVERKLDELFRRLERDEERS